ncbi:glycogen/starch/alpha-glucan phosphorylase [Afifella sp. H1R]|uniref:glycogen/starch/alpha-glucan phosphorylase n=1 Tax=Afifella sp. H1R TaxID=2908841 RepID=UPI001F30F3DE|nr:glycogen/starch/alpha-glucan phosphorylase [Afifella sp. H1R]MCF1505008.1 glycogen/starch/alpha-glucan phosphorylase [Afifella sp. H1R]
MNAATAVTLSRRIEDAEDVKRLIIEKLKYAVGKDPEHSVRQDWSAALILAVRDQLVDHWMASTRRAYEQDQKRVYYLSMEFLIGRLLKDTIINLGLEAPVREALTELGADYDEILRSEPDAALGNGGLGRLAACFLDSMSTLGIPAHGYGIRYENGLFRQSIRDGWQAEEPEDWLVTGHNWEFERPEVVYNIPFGGEVITTPEGKAVWHPAEVMLAAAYDTPIAGWRGRHVNTLRLWAGKPAKRVDLDRFNRGEYLSAMEAAVRAETVSRILYPDDTTEEGKNLRLRQEFFFTSASLQDLLRRYLSSHDDIMKLPEKVAIQLNDTHPAIAVAELMRLLVDTHGLSMEVAFQITRNTLSYTNHTLMPEALERWSLQLFGSVLPRHLDIIRWIDEQHLRTAAAAKRTLDLERVRIVDHTNGQGVRMGHLAFVGSHRVNGVSALHADLMKQTVFHDLDSLYPSRILGVTNGVTPRRWLHSCNKPLSDLLIETIGEDWIGDLEAIEAVAPYAEDAAFRERFRAAKHENKCRLVAEIQSRVGIHVSPDAMFDVQIKRMHEYKRQLLNIMEAVAQYFAIRNDPAADWTPRVKIFGGKAAPGYEMAKLIIKLINDVARAVNSDPVVGDRLKIVFLPNYNVSTAERIIPAADLSEQISTAGMEASGTGNMKLALNGALTIGTLDGANVEICDRVGRENIHIFGLTAEDVANYRISGYDSRAVIDGNETLKTVLDAIGSGVFSPEDPNRFRAIVDRLSYDDYFFVTADFAAYLDEQRKVDRAFMDKEDWTRRTILNTARVGWFSADRAIRDYAREIWNVETPSAEEINQGSE